METGSTNLPIFDLEDRRNAFDEFTRRVSEEPLQVSGLYQCPVIFMPHHGFEVVPRRQCRLASELQRRTVFEVSFAAERQR